jgi:hypothetical protein
MIPLKSQRIPLTHYRQLVKKKDHVKADIIDDRLQSIKTKPIQLVPSCWERDDLFSLRNSLISVIAHWEEIAPDSTTKTCLISFSKEKWEYTKTRWT